MPTPTTARLCEPNTSWHEANINPTLSLVQQQEAYAIQLTVPIRNDPTNLSAFERKPSFYIKSKFLCSRDFETPSLKVLQLQQARPAHAAPEYLGAQDAR
ncbi:hypothetical protein Emag_006357 [Eimeria magna]